MDNTTTENITKHISALNDSASLISEKVESGNTDEQTLGHVKRNYQHIEIMLAKDFIANSGEDLKVFEDAAAAGKAFVEANE